MLKRSVFWTEVIKYNVYSRTDQVKWHHDALLSLRPLKCESDIGESIPITQFYAKKWGFFPQYSLLSLSHEMVLLWLRHSFLKEKRTAQEVIQKLPAFCQPSLIGLLHVKCLFLSNALCKPMENILSPEHRCGRRQQHTNHEATHKKYAQVVEKHTQHHRTRPRSICRTKAHAALVDNTGALKVFPCRVFNDSLTLAPLVWLWYMILCLLPSFIINAFAPITMDIH